jgi:transcriptional regulator with XRE-family HTH domain
MFTRRRKKDMMLESIGARVRSQRLRRALSQTELSERTRDADGVAVTVATISRIENDRERMSRHPNMATVRKLADALGVDAGWLLTGEGEQQPAGDD